MFRVSLRLLIYMLVPQTWCPHCISECRIEHYKCLLTSRTESILIWHVAGVRPWLRAVPGARFCDPRTAAIAGRLYTSKRRSLPVQESIHTFISTRHERVENSLSHTKSYTFFFLPPTALRFLTSDLTVPFPSNSPPKYAHLVANKNAVAPMFPQITGFHAPTFRVPSHPIA
jgi:hypothetical protein